MARHPDGQEEDGFFVPGTLTGKIRQFSTAAEIIPLA